MTKHSSVIIEDIEFILDVKAIKNLYIRVKKDGKAYVSVPKRLPQTQIQMTLLSHLPWVKAQLAKLSSLSIKPELEYQSGEIHCLWGKSYPLLLETDHKKAEAFMRDDQMILQSNGDLTLEQKVKLLDNLYRMEIQKIMPTLILQWEETMQVQSSEWRLKKMKTRWGTCNTRAKRIWLNTELAKYPLECLEYVLVHELVHLLERSHNHRFKAFMTTFLPDWPVRRKLLNSLAMKMY
ncbi:M48 family metallopeptidase [Wohlfahrtiimonas populi]|uniref:M48 family metallopeptidase n=1 Tax=Wohlfahrtiimonas populi TaxID=1940240 RepID=UPI00098D0F6E|nr:SprT family zinc-dependent metalloprotease [Wohlfahrtiimonas populi]